MSARPYLLSSPAVMLLVGLLCAPLLLLGRVSLCAKPRGHGFFTPGTWTLANYTALADSHGLHLLLYTMAFGFAVALVVVLLGYALALFARSLTGAARWAVLASVLLPKFASALVILFGLRQILGSAGLVPSALAALIAESFLILPYAVLILFVQLSRLDPALEAAASGLGASAWQAFLRVTLPLSMPGLLLAAQLALVWGMGAFLGPMLLSGPQYHTLSVEVHRQAFEYNHWPRAAALAVVLTVAVGVCLLITSLLTHFRRHAS